MLKKERDGIRLGLICMTALGGILLFIVFALGINFLFMYNIIPVELMGIISKIIVFIISMIVASSIKRRIRKNEFINSMLGTMLYCTFVILLSVSNIKGDINMAGIVICILLCVLGCFLIFLKKDKSSKMHKNRHKHQ
ncbi:MAG: hypothetical protein E7420_04345 [Ruminococcaceae bacterium]|nr:hypothetical protein [Oscillospiraceae bacterium]